jgi:type IV pilus assembly protein PilP
MVKKLPLPNNIIVFVLCVVLAAFSSGCTKKEQSAPQPASPPPKPAAAVNAAKPVQNQPSSAKTGGQTLAQLDFANRKDPFKPFVAPKPQAEKESMAQRRAKPIDLLPIQSYEVTKFKVSGIIVGLKENRALLVDPAGKGYVVKQGMLIGNNNGAISRITPTYIEVVENYREDNGRLRKRTTKLTLLQKK